MKKYKITACYYTWCSLEIEAENEEQAWEMAKNADGGDFTPSEELSDWQINDVQEIED